MNDVAARLAAVETAIAEAARRHGRDAAAVRLVAVSKRQPAAALRAAHAAGQRRFGENYLQEAQAKQEALADLDLEWHFIGVIQGNKTAAIAERFDWVHTVDRARIATRLNDQRPAGRAPLKVLLQVNISGEASKGGVLPAELPALVAQVRGLPQLDLRGLMALPAPHADPAAQRAAFAAVARLARECGPGLDELSIGTSDDFASAIAEGATLVRLGTAVFGPRPAAA
ncbi:MAG: YggS family pyridoxal phosphate-dependent enzyme [Gammaproteobacteria bacterium]|nr:YggS family pyridoxal phosphate-dependent enzyme [Gammaproteobacteria bacterium]MCP5200505.1 YggS family pyridoxal phosphate-dependent enzyme [Gammaproteobacteria bacterium]